MPKLILLYNVFLITSSRYEGTGFQNALELPLRKVRLSKSVYRERSKTEICKYSLASLACIKWDHAFINVSIGEGHDSAELTEIIDFARGLFPDASISTNRASSRVEYLQKISKIKSICSDCFIFFCPNHDHIFTGSDTSIIFKSVEFAAELRKQQQRVTRVCYSHQLENILALRKSSPIHGIYHLGGTITHEDDQLIVAERERFAWDSYLISHINDLEAYIRFSNNDGYCPRGEDFYPHPFPEVKNLTVIPKYKLFDHYDGYFHIFALKQLEKIVPDLGYRVPPLFIPDGFFENDIKIRYGFTDTKSGWISLNSEVNILSFQDSEIKTDLNIPLSSIPLCWRNRISRLELASEKKVLSFSGNYSLSDGAPVSVEEQNPFYDFPSNQVEIIAKTFEDNQTRFDLFRILMVTVCKFIFGRAITNKLKSFVRGQPTN
jgi:hypothetical protein